MAGDKPYGNMAQRQVWQVTTRAQREGAHETRLALNLTEMAVIKKAARTMGGKPEQGFEDKL